MNRALGVTCVGPVRSCRTHRATMWAMETTGLLLRQSTRNFLLYSSRLDLSCSPHLEHQNGTRKTWTISCLSPCASAGTIWLPFASRPSTTLLFTGMLKTNAVKFSLPNQALSVGGSLLLLNYCQFYAELCMRYPSLAGQLPQFLLARECKEAQLC